MPAPILETARLRLRSWRDGDLVPFALLNADPRVMEYFPNVLDREQSDLLAARIRKGLSDREFGQWAVEVRGIADFVGFVGLSVPSFEAHFTPCVEIGWRLAFDYWGKGYASEAASAALAYAFGSLGLQEVVSFTASANRRSIAVMQRIGMTGSPADDFSHPTLPAGHPLQRHVLYRLKRSDWMGLKRPRDDNLAFI
jgi:RimJ/RimL family protein N-acetyltransferase